LLQLDLDITALITKSSTAALSLDEETSLINLEEKRKEFLLDEEKSWRLRSRATWLKWGDSNTKYFHKIANLNRNQKHIWSIEHANKGIIHGQESLKLEAASHFEQFYKSSSENHMSDKVSIASLFTN